MLSTKCFLAFSVLASSLITASCTAAESATFVINNAEAINCDRVCASVRFDVTVINNTDVPVCFSERYISRVSSVMSLARSGDESSDNFTDNPPPLEEIPDTEEHSADYAAQLRREPNIFVRPNGELRFTATTGGQYRIPTDQDIVAYLPIYLYPCQGESYERIQRTAQLMFE